MLEHLKRELECDAHNMQEACNLMVGKYNKSVAKYMRNLKKTILMQRKTIKRISDGTTRQTLRFKF